MQLAKIENKENVTSLELLEQINFFRKEEGARTELRHADLLKTVRDEFVEEINEGKIPLVEYKDKKGEIRPMYQLTLSQAKQVLVRESKYVRKAVINYIEVLENKVKNPFQVPSNFKEALLLAAEQQEQIEKLENKIEIQEQLIAEFEPKKEYLDQILSSTTTMTITQIAADYGMSGVALNKILHDQGLIRKVDEQWLLYTKHMKKGYTKSSAFMVSKKDGTQEPKPNTRWTQKGRLKIHEILSSMNIKANVDEEQAG